MPLAHGVCGDRGIADMVVAGADILAAILAVASVAQVHWM